MKVTRLSLTLILTATALAGATPASGAILELGPLGTATPGCPGFTPANCRIGVVKQTGFQAKVGTTKNFSTANANGYIVAWTIPLPALTTTQVREASKTRGGAPRAQIVVLAPLGSSKFKVVGRSPMVDLSRYMGTSPTFALAKALPIKKGQVVGITVPSWAPSLQLGVGSDTSWRSTRPLKEAAADNFTTQRALVGETTTGTFTALYQRARLVYSTTFIPNPTAKTTK